MKIENYSVSYANKVVFSNFNLEILEGEITCVLGSSGAGKTTLINHICEVFEKENKQVAVAFQEPRLFNHLTVLENLKLIGYGEEEIVNALKKVGLENSENAYPNTLSGGEKQRVNFVRAFLSNCDALILDEPFSSIDVKLKLNLINLLVSEKQGKTIIFVTHDIEEALMLSSRVILLKDGKVALDYKLQKPLKEREFGKLNLEREVLLNAQLKY